MRHLNLKRFALVIFAVFSLSFITVAYFNENGVSDSWSALIIAYKAIPLVLFVVGLFIAYAWRWKIFQKWLVPFPDLNGTWQGELQTTWTNPETGKIPPPTPVIVTIKQSFLNVSCVMRTVEMTSRGYIADFWLDSDAQIRML